MTLTASSQALFYLVFLLSSLLCILGIKGVAIEKDGTTTVISSGLMPSSSHTTNCIQQPEQMENELVQLKEVVITVWLIH